MNLPKSHVGAMLSTLQQGRDLPADPVGAVALACVVEADEVIGSMVSTAEGMVTVLLLTESSIVYAHFPLDISGFGGRRMEANVGVWRRLVSEVTAIEVPRVEAAEFPDSWFVSPSYVIRFASHPDLVLDSWSDTEVADFVPSLLQRWIPRLT
jgi:hypothetical protein